MSTTVSPVHSSISAVSTHAWPAVGPLASRDSAINSWRTSCDIASRSTPRCSSQVTDVIFTLTGKTERPFNGKSSVLSTESCEWMTGFSSIRRRSQRGRRRSLMRAAHGYWFIRSWPLLGLLLLLLLLRLVITMTLTVTKNLRSNERWLVAEVTVVSHAIVSDVRGTDEYDYGYARVRVKNHHATATGIYPPPPICAHLRACGMLAKNVFIQSFIQ